MNLLAHYGWQMSILLQEEHDGLRVVVDIQQGNHGLTLVYSLAESMNDDFVKDHARRDLHITVNMPGAQFFSQDCSIRRPALKSNAKDCQTERAKIHRTTQWASHLVQTSCGAWITRLPNSKSEGDSPVFRYTSQATPESNGPSHTLSSKALSDEKRTHQTGNT